MHEAAPHDGLMRVTIRDINGKIHFIPNSLLITSRVVNYNKSGFIEIQVPLIISARKHPSGANQL
jgi:small-conductance mechanosensitive channel